MYVIENGEEVFQGWLTTMKHVKGEENTVLGLTLGGVVGVVGHMMAMESRGRGLSIVGGKFSIANIRLLVVLARKNRVALLGELGLVFAIVKHNVPL